MKIVSIRTYGGIEFAGRVYLDDMPVKTPDGWMTVGKIDPSNITELKSIVVHQPMEVARTPVASRQGPPQMIPILTQLLLSGVNGGSEDLPMPTKDIMCMTEAHPEFADMYIKITSPVDLESAPSMKKSNILTPGGR